MTRAGTYLRKIAAVGFFPCSSVPSQAADLVIAMPNWPSGQAGANILKVAIAQAVGLNAEVRELGAMIAFAGMASGEVDVVPEIGPPTSTIS